MGGGGGLACGWCCGVGGCLVVVGLGWGSVVGWVLFALLSLSSCRLSCCFPCLSFLGSWFCLLCPVPGFVQGLLGPCLVCRLLSCLSSAAVVAAVPALCWACCGLSCFVVCACCLVCRWWLSCAAVLGSSECGCVGPAVGLLPCCGWRRIAPRRRWSAGT